MLWLGLSLPGLALATLARGLAPTTPVVVLDARQRVWQASPRARRAGIQPGTSAAAARARLPGLVCLQRDPAAEAAALTRLADWLYGFSPWVCPAPPDALLLEVEGSLALFGGLARLRRRLLRELRQRGYRGRVGVAPTPLAALVLAASGTTVTDPGALPGVLDAQPLEALPLDAARYALLHELGLYNLGALRALPRAALARRLGPDLPDWLDRLLGLAPDPRPRHHPVARFRAELALPGVETLAALAFPARRLLEELADWLACRQQGVQALTLTLGLADGGHRCLTLRLQRPGRDPAHWLALLRERWSRLDLPAPVTALQLRAERTLPLPGETLPLIVDSRVLARTLEGVLEQLRARLGEGAVRGIAVYPDHRPEQAWRAVAPGETGPRLVLPGRPLWLLATPLALAAAPGPVLAGPERIESGWWDGDDVSRDYFRCRGGGGARCWLFRERRGHHGWFLHGLFA